MSGDAAEDLAQEVLLLLATKYADLTDPEDMVPVAFKIIRFKMMAHMRKVGRHGEVAMTAHDGTSMDFADPVAWQDPEDQLRRRELSERLTVAMRQLTGRCRALFRLKLEGHRFAEIQKALGARSINTVYTWDARCRDRLLELMGGAWER